MGVGNFASKYAGYCSDVVSQQLRTLPSVMDSLNSFTNILTTGLPTSFEVQQVWY